MLGRLGGLMTVYAWLVIAPVNEELEGVDEDGYSRIGLGVQRMYTAEFYEELDSQMSTTLELLGADPNELTVQPGLITEGELRAVESPSPTGLKWGVYPCYKDGRNVDVDPIEPRGE